MPTRLLREAILDSERVCSLSFPAEVFYRRLMSVVDDFGRFDGRLSVLRSRLYPLQIEKVREADIERWIAECVKAGLIVLYSVSAKPYILFRNLGEPRAKESKYPAPPSESERTQPHASANICAQTQTDVNGCAQTRADVPYSDSNADSDSDSTLAASPPVAEPLPPERRGKSPKPPPKPRPPDELFDAIVAVTGSDPKVNASYVAKLKNKLANADPPYRPEEVLRMAEPGFQARELPWKRGEKLTLGEVEKFIARTRNPSNAARNAGDGRDRFRADTDPVADKYTPQGIARLRGESASPVAGNAAAVGPPDGPSPAESSAGQAGGNGDGLSW